MGSLKECDKIFRLEWKIHCCCAYFPKTYTGLCCYFILWNNYFVHFFFYYVSFTWIILFGGQQATQKEQERDSHRISGSVQPLPTVISHLIHFLVQTLDLPSTKMHLQASTLIGNPWFRKSTILNKIGLSCSHRCTHILPNLIFGTLPAGTYNPPSAARPSTMTSRKLLSDWLSWFKGCRVLVYPPQCCICSKQSNTFAEISCTPWPFSHITRTS